MSQKRSYEELEKRILELEKARKEHCRSQEALKASEKKFMQEALEEKNILFASLSSNAPGMIYQFMRKIDGTYCFPFSTEKIKDFFDCSPEEVEEDFSPITKVLLPEDIDRVIDSIEASAENMTIWQCEFRVQIPGDPVRWMFTQSSPQKLSDGSIVWHGFISDITELKETDEALRRSEIRYRSLFDNSSDAFLLTAPDGTILDANPAACEMFGRSLEEIIKIGRNGLVDVSDARLSKALEERAEKGKVRAEINMIRADGIKFAAEITSAVYYDENGEQRSSMIIRDVSDLKRAEKEKEKLQVQLLQSQKMEAIGRLAGGVAHDLNNMLGVISGYAELALGDVNPAKPLYENLVQIREAARRSADLTKKLLAFARKQIIEPKVLDLNERVENMLKMINRIIGENIDLLWMPGKNLWPVMMDPSQIDQVLLNLCNNARDSITGQGKIIIETNNVTIHENSTEKRSWFLPGDYALISVSDDGCGMDEVMLENIFEPFFTTKEVGKGTGLGLPMVYGIVKQNKGFINVYSELGHGTTFRIYLPRQLEQSDIKNVPDQQGVLMGESETILLVEDDLEMLKVCNSMLKSLGYSVLQAESPMEAMKIVEKHSKDISLLITDVIMPEMNGVDLANKLRSFHPEMKVLFISGYTGNMIFRNGILDEGMCFIQKPLFLKNFSIKIREALIK